MPCPVLEVTRLEHPADQLQEPAIVDLLRQGREHDLVVERPEAVGDVALDEPVRPLPDVNHLAERCGSPGRGGTRGNGQRTGARSTPQAAGALPQRLACPTTSARPGC